jgi:hypothetical protein
MGQEWRFAFWIGPADASGELQREFERIPFEVHSLGSHELFERLVEIDRADPRGRRSVRYGAVALTRLRTHTYSTITWMSGPVAKLDPRDNLPTQWLDATYGHLILRPAMAPAGGNDGLLQSVWFGRGPAPASVRYDLGFALQPLSSSLHEPTTGLEDFTGPSAVAGRQDLTRWEVLRASEGGQALVVHQCNRTLLPVFAALLIDGATSWSIALRWFRSSGGWFPARAMQLLYGPGGQVEVRYFETATVAPTKAPARIQVVHPTQVLSVGDELGQAYETSTYQAWPAWLTELVELRSRGTADRVPSGGTGSWAGAVLLLAGALLIGLGFWSRRRSKEMRSPEGGGK